MSDKRHHDHAWAPYNFVSLPDELLPAPVDSDGIPQRHDIYNAERHTGYFNVRMETVTPLFIRGMLSVDDYVGLDEKELGELSRKNPHMFSLDGNRPVVPGSSLRGEIRALVEIITNSKMHFVSDDLLIYRSVFGNDSSVNTYRNTITDVLGDRNFRYPSKYMRGGYLKRDASGWAIQPAQEHEGESIVLVDLDKIRDAGIQENRIRNPRSVSESTTHSVYVQPGRRKTYNSRVTLQVAEAGGIHDGNMDSPPPGYEPATLIIAKTVGKRHWYPAIYAEDPEADPISIPQNIWDAFVEDRDMKRGIDNRSISEEGDALFYLVDDDNNIVFLGPTMFFRVPYENSIGDLIPEDLRKHEGPMDYTEAMFGYVTEQDETREPKAYGGRISVTSAHVIDDVESYYDEMVIPDILSSPKPTTFQHYVKQPDDNGNHSFDIHPADLTHYGHDGSELRGHKMYWRQNQENLRDIRAPEYKNRPQTAQTLDEAGDTQHTVIRPVRSGVTFEFKIYFDNLSDTELGALIWALTLGNDPDAYHQLGMGKPFGLGVVAFRPTLMLTERSGQDGRYTKLFNDDGEWHLPETTVSRREQKQFVDPFKSLFDNFDNQEHIQELKELLRIRKPSDRFSYMKIEGGPRGERNDYDDRPVLPLASDIGREMRHEQIKETRARVETNGLEKGDIIEGSVMMIRKNEIWISPQNIIIFGNTYSLHDEIAYDYNFKSPLLDDIQEGDVIRGCVNHIDDNGNPPDLWLDLLE